ncbi:hypothetical protein F383_12655 [Gossypium arboreum]|uniref:Uncharacterized protein n=1 Tax=Gossypium arboreum TaxID=29729 RepID=A0A0B0NEN0_GOSAR|nr:hypothetical protein F383_12655 [Gossypium arboreum]
MTKSKHEILPTFTEFPKIGALQIVSN